VRTVFAEAEKLTESFPENSFDLVSARNSIDHTYDPLEAIKQMLRCVKENHILAMDHVENEGNNQHYRGLHQWDLTVERAEFLIRGKGRVINVSRELASLGEFKCSRRQGLATWITVEVRKKPAASHSKWNFLRGSRGRQLFPLSDYLVSDRIDRSVRYVKI
jgi:SAM-dependent methyltransferase